MNRKQKMVPWTSLNLATGETQTTVPDMPQRKIPATGLKPKKAQSNKPTLLEMYEAEVKQPKLF